MSQNSIEVRLLDRASNFVSYLTIAEFYESPDVIKFNGKYYMRAAGTSYKESVFFDATPNVTAYAGRSG